MDEKKEEMKEVEGFNFKLVLVNLVELVVLVIISCIVYSNIFVWFKSTSYIGSSSFWWVIALFLSVYGLIFIIKANVNNSIHKSIAYRHYPTESTCYKQLASIFLSIAKLCYILAAIVTILIIIMSVKNSSLVTSKDRYNEVSNMVEIIKGDESSDAFPNLLGKNNDTSNLPLI